MDSARVVVRDTSTTKPGLQFRQARFDDHRQIAELQARYLMDTESYEAWLHLWTENPVYQNFPDWPIGWVLENEADQVVGYLGNLPRLYELGNQKVIVSSTRGLVVDVAYRSYSLQLLSRFFNQKQVDLFLDTTVSPGALKVHEVFRASRVPVGVWDQSSFWITNYEGFSTSLLARKEIRRQWGLQYPLSACLFLRDTFAGRLLRKRENGTQPEFCNKFDERFNTFWHRLREAWPNRLLANRSQQLLEWHFQHPLAEGRAWILAVSNHLGLKAYAVFLRQDNAALRLKRMRMVDYQELDGTVASLRGVLSHALDRCRREGIHMLEVMGSGPAKQRVIDDLLPHKRALSSWRYFYKTANPELAASLRDPQVWDPTCFDGDASL